MSLLYLDTFSGIAGDMLLGLLVDLGLDPRQLEDELGKLPVTGWDIRWERQQRLGITGTRALVSCSQPQPHRTWSEIDRMLADSPLDPAAAKLARAIFRRLGEAEARVHGVPLERVHFHEVGAVDAIIDVTGAAVGLQLLGIDQLLCSPLPLSSGMVKTDHGNYPLPAPAVAALLEGAPVVNAEATRELVTPTGAAIAVTAARFAPLPAMTLGRVGYGVGGHELTDRPNLLRGLLGEPAAASGLQRDEIVVLECHLDDSPPEWLGDLSERLLEAGALDVALAPLQMKKNRPGCALTVLAEPADETALTRLILTGSSAIGLRSSRARRFKLERRLASVTTELGEVRVKLIYDAGQLLRITPEYDDCRALSRHSGRPLPEIYRLAERAADKLFSSSN